jgi:hypothetical protein
MGMSEKLPKTIQFFLPQSEPRGIRIADITARIVQAVPVPHSKLSEAATAAELDVLLPSILDKAFKGEL